MISQQKHFNDQLQRVLDANRDNSDNIIHIQASCGSTKSKQLNISEQQLKDVREVLTDDFEYVSGDVALELSGLRLNSEQRKLIELVVGGLSFDKVGLVYIWKGSTGRTEVYTYRDTVRNLSNAGLQTSFHAFNSKDEMIGWFKALNWLDSKTIHKTFFKG